MRADREPMTWMDADAPALGGEERSDETPKAETGRASRAPDPQVVAKPTWRQFTVEYRLRIIEEADRCTRPGEVGRLLRREGLYPSHLSAWRKARRNGSLRDLTPNKRGAEPRREFRRLFRVSHAASADRVLSVAMYEWPTAVKEPARQDQIETARLNSFPRRVPWGEDLKLTSSTTSK